MQIPLALSLGDESRLVQVRDRVDLPLLPNQSMVSSRSLRVGAQDMASRGFADRLARPFIVGFPRTLDIVLIAAWPRSSVEKTAPRVNRDSWYNTGSTHMRSACDAPRVGRARRQGRVWEAMLTLVDGPDRSGSMLSGTARWDTTDYYERHRIGVYRAT